MYINVICVLQVIICVDSFFLYFVKVLTDVLPPSDVRHKKIARFQRMDLKVTASSLVLLPLE